MTLADTVKEKREEFLKAAARRGAMNVRLFGSPAQGEEKAASDADLLVDMEEGRGLLDISRLLQDVEELPGCPVHVVEPEALPWAIRYGIKEDAVQF
jgi:predicted nucleotidyltransferase